MYTKTKNELEDKTKKIATLFTLFKGKLKHLIEYFWIQNFNIYQLVRNINQEAATVFVRIYLYELNSTFLTSVLYILVLYLTFEFLSSFKYAKEEVINLFQFIEFQRLYTVVIV